MMSEKFSSNELGGEAYDRRDSSPESSMTPKEQILSIKEDIKAAEIKIKKLTAEFEAMAEDDHPTSRVELEAAIAKIEDLRTDQGIMRDKILAIINQMDKLDVENLTTELNRPERQN